MLQGGCFAVGYLLAAMVVLSSTETISHRPMEISLELRFWMLGRLPLDPFALLGLISGAGYLVVVWSAILILGIVFPRVVMVQVLACVAALMWPLAALIEWGLVVS